MKQQNQERKVVSSTLSAIISWLLKQQQGFKKKSYIRLYMSSSKPLPSPPLEEQSSDLRGDPLTVQSAEFLQILDAQGLSCCFELVPLTEGYKKRLPKEACKNSSLLCNPFPRHLTEDSGRNALLPLSDNRGAGLHTNQKAAVKKMFSQEMCLFCK